jgi:hypothetical protein
MKGMKKVISILVRIISITRMKLLMLPKAKKLDHFARKMGLQTNIYHKFDDVSQIKFCNYPPTSRKGDLL